MGKHAQHEMHENSLTAYRSITDLSKRAQDIYYTLAHSPRAMTAREVLDKLFPGRGDPNLVRPRLTELKDDGWVVEVTNVVDDLTGCTVSAFRAVSPDTREKLLENRLREKIDGQGEMF